MAAYGQANPVSIATSGERTQAVNVAVNFVKTYGFDGVMDDLYEGMARGCTDSNYVSFANALGTAMHNAGKKASCALFGQYATNYPLLYGGITTMDYIQPMFYSNIAANPSAVADVLINLLLPKSSCPILAGFFESSTYSLATQLNAIGHPTNSKFAGVSPYSLVTMKTNDWTALTAWSK